MSRARLTHMVGLSLAATLFVGSPASAQSAPDDVRQVELVDGRIIHGGVVTTEPGGIRLQVPQGQTVVGFHQLKNIKPSDAPSWLGQRVWEVVVVGPDDERRTVEQAVRSYSSIKVAGDQGIPRALSPAAITAAHACAPAQVQCAVTAAARDEAWSWIVTVEPQETGAVVLRSNTSQNGGTRKVTLKDLRDAGALLDGLDTLFELSEVPGRAAAEQRLQAALGDKRDPKEKPPREKKPKDKPPKEPRAPVAANGLEALVPVPGYPALKRGDMTTFGVALGVAVPTTIAWIGATGSQSQSLPEHAALSVGGYYLSTVVINHVVGARMNRAGVAVGPTERGRGASLQLRVQLD